VERNAVLFLGAGVSRTLWDSNKLAEELFNELGPRDLSIHRASVCKEWLTSTTQKKSTRQSLQQAYEYNKGWREPPPELIEITKHPWKAIYTTNYDDFIESNLRRCARVRANTIFVQQDIETF